MAYKQLFLIAETTRTGVPIAICKCVMRNAKLIRTPRLHAPTVTPEPLKWHSDRSLPRAARWKRAPFFRLHRLVASFASSVQLPKSANAPNQTSQAIHRLPREDLAGCPQKAMPGAGSQYPILKQTGCLFQHTGTAPAYRAGSPPAARRAAFGADLHK